MIDKRRQTGTGRAYGATQEPKDYEVNVREPIENTEYLGIIYALIADLGDDAGVDLVKGDDPSKIYSSGSAKNEGSAAISVRLKSATFSGGYADVSLAAGEIVGFERMPLMSISVPNNTTNSGATPSVKVVVATYCANKMSSEGPTIYIR
jgi:hypothetical protein